MGIVMVVKNEKFGIGRVMKEMVKCGGETAVHWKWTVYMEAGKRE